MNVEGFQTFCVTENDFIEFVFNMSIFCISYIKNNYLNGYYYKKISFSFQSIIVYDEMI